MRRGSAAGGQGECAPVASRAVASFPRGAALRAFRCFLFVLFRARPGAAREPAAPGRPWAARWHIVIIFFSFPLFIRLTVLLLVLLVFFLFLVLVVLFFLLIISLPTLGNFGSAGTVAFV
ncbi:unnamed protein product [Prorocentrum cordatum]|uniref:Uncharacterized protein n=1 Tax=Prorocentrum cordatum TaxID=2364126 RepID=A0ABN9WX48_9DINO|nr:unnamed protein product [Polarella glacialis]